MHCILLLKTWHDSYIWRHSCCRRTVVIAVITDRKTRAQHVKRCERPGHPSQSVDFSFFSSLCPPSSFPEYHSHFHSVLSSFACYSLLLSSSAARMHTHTDTSTHLSVICVRWFLMHLRPTGSSHSNLHQHPLPWLFVCVLVKCVGLHGFVSVL